MMGLSASITPINRGVILVLASGDVDNNTNSRGVTMQLRYGTGTAPINGTALTGTLVATLAFTQNNANIRVPFCFNDILSGLTLNTYYWIDISIASAGGAGTSRIRNINISLLEI
jgi:hypothetical protein